MAHPDDRVRTIYQRLAAIYDLAARVPVIAQPRRTVTPSPNAAGHVTLRCACYVLWSKHKGELMFAAYVTVTILASVFNGIAAVTYLIGHDYPKPRRT